MATSVARSPMLGEMPVVSKSMMAMALTVWSWLKGTTIISSGARC